jgi:arylsulfatase A-like enzyme
LTNSAKAARRPNVVLILTDDQGYGELACTGNPIIKTPHLDKLYTESVRLTDFHVNAVCSPSRAALMTGKYASRVGVWHTLGARDHPSRGNPDAGRVCSRWLPHHDGRQVAQR